MAKDPHKQQGWGTWDELLLAFAVKRHGFMNWDSVAGEIQSKSSLPRAQTTAQNCQQKYHDLNLRFANRPPYSLANNEQIRPQAIPAAVEEENINIPWLEDLRKLRVAELKQEVHRYDASILSLQLKVKSLEEERGKNLEAGEEDQAKADLKQQEAETDGNRKALLTVSVPDEESDWDSRSVCESHTTGSKGEATAELKDEAEVKLAGEGWSEQDTVPTCSNSHESPSSLVMERKRETGDHDVLPENVGENLTFDAHKTPVTGGRSLRRITSKNHSKDASSPIKKQTRTRRSHRAGAGSAEKSGTRLTDRKTERVALEKKGRAAKKNPPVVLKNRGGNGSVELKKNSNRGSVTLKKNSRGSRVTRKKNIGGGSNHPIVESKTKSSSSGTGVKMKERTPRENCEKKQAKEIGNNQPKNSVGRPSKEETKVNKISGKHKRDDDEKDVARRPRTRPRR